MSVCDMDSLEMERWCEYSVDTYDDMKTCATDLMSRNCAKAKIGDQVWPYKFAATRKHRGSWGDDGSGVLRWAGTT